MSHHVVLLSWDLLETCRGGRYRKPPKLENRHVSGCKVGAWYLIQAIDLKFGRECCSDDSISFHYVDEQLMRRLHDLLHLCPKDVVDGVAVV